LMAPEVVRARDAAKLVGRHAFEICDGHVSPLQSM
jgi:hypothetical protein